VSDGISERSPATGEVLGTVARATAEDVRRAAALGARAQPLWAAVPVEARARALRRAAQAVLDELDELAVLLARETGRPRTEAMLAELLPAVSGLHAIADAAPAALGDQRLGRRAALRAGRRAALVQRPVGVAGIRGGAASPWAEPLLETASALVAGNAVVLVPRARLAGERLAAAFARAGVPEELVTVLHGDAAANALEAVCGEVTELDPPAGKGTMLVLAGAPVRQAVAGALWAGFASGGRHPAAVGRVVVVPALAEALVAGLTEGARRLRVGDPVDPDTEVGPLPSGEALAAVEALVAEAEADGAVRLCGGPVTVRGLSGAFFAPVVLRGVAPEARVLREPAAGPVIAVVEAPDEAAAIALADEDTRGAVSVWAGDRDRGERIARRISAELAWVNEHGYAAAAAPVRIAHHVRVRQLASQPSGLRSARWLPHDAALVSARVTAARVLHGRESERWQALRRGALPLARTVARLARDARRD
jgi:acyl-CoA reductase-like NAD-dependent aldehyde dehydrogenase